MRLITRPACAASLRQRCTSFSSSSSSGESFFNGWGLVPGTSPATSQFDWLISMTAISVLSWSKAVRDRLRSFDCGMGHSIGLLDSAEGDMPSPLAPYHLHSPPFGRMPASACGAVEQERDRCVFRGGVDLLSVCPETFQRGNRHFRVVSNASFPREISPDGVYAGSKTQ